MVSKRNAENDQRRQLVSDENAPMVEKQRNPMKRVVKVNSERDSHQSVWGFFRSMRSLIFQLRQAAALSTL